VAKMSGGELLWLFIGMLVIGWILIDWLRP
jgi:hypothetical protein